MKNLFRIISILIFLIISITTSAQIFEVKGKVSETKTGETMIGVNIIIVGDIHGTISGYNGEFLLKSKLQPPFSLQFSFVGFESKTVEVTKSTKFLDIKMDEQISLGEEVVVSASRIEENILRSAVSVEKMNLKYIQQISTANFYDGLYQLKGVDMNVPFIPPGP